MLHKSALTGKDAFDISSWSWPSFILSSLFLNFRPSEEVCEIGAFVCAGVILFPFLFKIFFVGDMAFLLNFWSFGSFYLVYLLKAHMKLNGWKWLDEMEQSNSEKNQKFLVLNDKWFFYLLTFNSRADFMTRYTFNQVRCFFYI